MVSIAVIGSINEDVILTVSDAPRPGETVLASDARHGCGGKGANQAVAAAELGVDVWLVGLVGDDDSGARQLQDLASRGVQVSHVGTVADARTGLAVVTVTEDGENSIVVASGANALLTAARVNQALDRILGVTGDDLRVVVAQAEVGASAVAAAVEWAAEHGCRVVVNAAPPVELADGGWATADPLVVNVHEAAVLAGRDVVVDVEAAIHQAGHLRRTLGCRSVVITLGGSGAVTHDAEQRRHVPASPAHVVDTTGAGDAFVGALAAMVARGENLATASTIACGVAGRIVGVVGARSNLPSRPAITPAPR